MAKAKRCFVLFILLVLLVFSNIHAQDAQFQDQTTRDELTLNGKTFHCLTQDGITVYDFSVDDKRAMRRHLMAQFILDYTENQTFEKVNQYMILKFQEMSHANAPCSSDLLLQETFEKSNNLLAQTRKFFGNSFTRVYDPETIAKKVRKYLWLRGLYFWILGISDEHRLAFSYFYLPGNEDIKLDFLKKAVRFSYPEVSDREENKAWQSKMVGVMDRLGYDIFKLKKFGIGSAEPSQN